MTFFPFPDAGEYYDGNVGMEGGAPGDRNASLLAYRQLEPVGVALIQRIADALPLMSRLNDLLPTVSLIDLNALSGLSATLATTVKGTDYAVDKTATAAAIALKLDASLFNPAVFAPASLITVVAGKLDANLFNPAAFAPAASGITTSERAAIAALGSASTHPATDFMAAGAVSQYTNAMVDARIGAASIDALADVDTTTAAPTDGQVMTWNNVAHQWKPAGLPPGASQYTDAMARAAVGPIPTQYTDAMADARVAASLKAYRITWFWTSALAANEILMIHTFTDAATFAANFADAQAHVDGVNPGATQTLDVQKNNVSVGTISISNTGVFTFTTVGGAIVSFAVGDRMKIVGQAGVETSTNVSGTFRGTYS